MKALGKVAVHLHAFFNNALKVRLQGLRERGLDILRKIPLAYTGNRNDSFSQYSSHYADRAKPATKNNRIPPFLLWFIVRCCCSLATQRQTVRWLLKWGEFRRKSLELSWGNLPTTACRDWEITIQASLEINGVPTEIRTRQIHKPKASPPHRSSLKGGAKVTWNSMISPNFSSQTR